MDINNVVVCVFPLGALVLGLAVETEETVIGRCGYWLNKMKEIYFELEQAYILKGRQGG
jgi:hypothetical protein